MPTQCFATANANSYLLQTTAQTDRWDKIDPSVHIDIVQKLNGMGLPLDDDWLYQTFGVEKPKDYDKLKAEAQERKDALREALNGNTSNPSNSSNPSNPSNSSNLSNAFERRSNAAQTTIKGSANEQHGTRSNVRVQPDFEKFKDRLKGFFGLAPHTGADTDF